MGFIKNTVVAVNAKAIFSYFVTDQILYYGWLNNNIHKLSLVLSTPAKD